MLGFATNNTAPQAIQQILKFGPTNQNNLNNNNEKCAIGSLLEIVEFLKS